MRLGFEGRGRRPGRCSRRATRASSRCRGASTRPPTTVDEAYRRLTWTAHHWQHWLARGTFPDHPWRGHLERSALTLKGLTFGRSGALLAAPTTSLPETPGGERNWDYRFTWIRDSTLALWALDTLGFDWEAEDFFCFIADVAERSTICRSCTESTGRRTSANRSSAHAGVQHSRPVRIGNGAFDQRQHDVWGALLDSVYIHTSSRHGLDERLWPFLSRFVEAAIEHWREPDRGIWEVRGEAQHFTSSKVMCWVAADRGARLARLREEFEVAERWQQAADEMKEDILAHGVDDRGVFVQHYGTSALDASTLLIPLVGFLPPTDPRIVATVNAIAEELTEEGLVLRYRVEETDDGMTGEEGSFTICSFWLVSAFALIGEHARARRLCEKLLSFASPLGSLRRGDRSGERSPAGQLPAGVHPPGVDQRSAARGRRRGGSGGPRPRRDAVERYGQRASTRSVIIVWDVGARPQGTVAGGGKT